MQNTYQPISCSYHDVLLAQATKKIYAKIEYYTEIGGLLTTMSVIKDIYTQKGEEFMKLANGEIIRLDRIVAVDKHISPHHSDFIDFSCDC